MISGILEEMTVADICGFDPQVVVLGIGSTEPHGPALPYGTDYFQCDAVCRMAVTQANKQVARVLMFPTLSIGCNANFKAFPFASRIAPQTMMNVLLDIISALEADGVRKIVLINGHGGNTDVIRAALRAHFHHADESTRAFVCTTNIWGGEMSEFVEHDSPHGGESEASQMMHLRGELVHEDAFQDQPVAWTNLATLSPSEVYFVPPWHLHVPMSGGGDTRKSSAEKGRSILESVCERLTKLLVELSQAPWHRDFPFPPKK